MKKILSYCGIGVVIFAISVAISVETAQNVFAITTMGIEHSCDLSGEEQMAYEIINGYFPTTVETLEEAINDGYLVSYVDTFKANGLISADFVPTGKSSTSGSSEKKPTTSTTKAPTLTETEAAAYVVVKSSEVYDGYDGGKKTGAVLDPDTDVMVTGYTSNSYYRLEDGTYVPKTGIATKGDYDAAWSVTEEIPATCIEAGSVKSVNALSGKESEEIIEALGHDYAMTDYAEPTCTETGYDTYVCNACGDTYTEEIEATGHEAGEPVVTIEPKTFSKGEKTTCCSVCGEVLTEEEVPQTFPIPLWGVIAIAVVVVGGVATGVVLVIRKKRK